MLKENIDLKRFIKAMERVNLKAGRGSFERSFYDQLSGINTLSVQPTLPQVKQRGGLTFWTRPSLNLSDANLRAWPAFYDMIGDTEMMSFMSIVRSWLDPRGCWYPEKPGGAPRLSPLIDNRSPFIPWLSNSLLSISGWQDIVVGTHTSSEGNHHEAYSLIDDTPKNYRIWDLSSSHRNTEGNLIGILLYVWVVTAALTFEGDMIPYPTSVIPRRRNYMSRIYRFSTDERMHRIEEWWSTIVYPYTAPTATNANYSVDSPYNLESAQVGISWKASALETYLPRTLNEFNRISIYFNPKLHPKIRNKHMIQLTTEEWPRFNYKTYLLIDVDNKTFERWVPREEYKRVMESMSSRIFVPEQFGDIQQGQQTEQLGELGQRLQRNQDNPSLIVI